MKRIGYLKNEKRAEIKLLSFSRYEKSLVQWMIYCIFRKLITVKFSKQKFSGACFSKQNEIIAQRWKDWKTVSFEERKKIIISGKIEYFEILIWNLLK